MSVFEKIEAQRKGKEGTDVWMVGQQLMDIIRAEGCEDLVEADIDTITLRTVAGKIKGYADKHHGKERCFCVPPDVAADIIRESNGITNTEKPEAIQEAPKQMGGMLNLEDFL